MGGSPLRLLRVSARASAVINRWQAGAPVGDRKGEPVLARRLVSAGVFLPRPGHAVFGPDDVTVVIPVRDRPDQLRRLLSMLDTKRCVVVDDASSDPARTRAIAEQAGAQVIALPANLGPSAARNAGLAQAATPLVVFIDSDCVPDDGWLEPVLAHFNDPLVAAVAPRIVPRTAGPPTSLTRYEAVRSSLDRGSAPGLVRPMSRIPYVPSAALVVRRAAVPDCALRRTAQGRRGRRPGVAARRGRMGRAVRAVSHRGARRAHDPRLLAGPARLLRHHRRPTGPSPPPVARPPPHLGLDGLRLGPGGGPQAAPGCRGPGRLPAGPGPTARRLGGPPAHGGRPDRRRRHRQVGPPGPERPGPRLVPRPAPRSVLAQDPPRRRAGPARSGRRGLDRRARAPLDPVRFGALHVADDLAYGSGVWLGCLRARTLAPLLPRIELRARVWSTRSLRAQLGQAQPDTTKRSDHPAPVR